MTMDSVMNLVREKPVVIFSKKSCNCMSATIESLLLSFGANFTVYELDQLPNGNQIERELKATGRKPSLPAVFIGQELVGGVDEVMTLHLGNQLVSLLMRANAIWIWHGKN